jgi:hypothetical protein
MLRLLPSHSGPRPLGRLDGRTAVSGEADFPCGAEEDGANSSNLAIVDRGARSEDTCQVPHICGLAFHHVVSHRRPAHCASPGVS